MAVCVIHGVQGATDDRIIAPHEIETAGDYGRTIT